MKKCRRRQTTDLQKLKNCQRSFSQFVSVEAEVIGMEAEAEAVDKIVACTSLFSTRREVIKTYFLKK